MDRARIGEIAERWMIPTSKATYMAGLEKKPVIAAASGVRVIDTAGKEYLDFGSGQMAAALGHNQSARRPGYQGSTIPSNESIDCISRKNYYDCKDPCDWKVNAYC